MASSTLIREDSRFPASLGTDKIKLKYSETNGKAATLVMEHKSENTFGWDTFKVCVWRSSKSTSRDKFSGLFFGLGFTF